MYVAVDLEADPPAVALAEPDDCTRFHVAVTGTGDAAAADRALRAHKAGAIDGDGEALVLVAAVRALAEGSVGPDWESKFTAMLDYASSKGWLSDDAASIRAHLQWQ